MKGQHSNRAASRTGESIAVLPLVNATATGAAVLFGCVRDLIDVLATIKGLRVIARSSSFLFRNSQRSPRDMASSWALPTC